MLQIVANLSYRTLLVSGAALAVPSALLYRRFYSNMPSLKQVRSENALYSPGYTPVAVFVGGTSGVGQGMAQAFARHTKGNAHIILIGRNKEAAEQIISTFPKPTSSEAKHEFIQSDVTLMSNVHSTTSSLLSSLPKINYLVLTPGVLTTNGRNETSEGIDRKLALHYYARFAFIHDLLPLLKNAEERGEDAKAYSVLAAGQGRKVDLDDLGLKKTFSLMNAATQGVSYMDIALDKFARDHPNITFSHAYPGGVKTGIAKNSDTAWIRLLNSTLVPLFSPFILSVEESGEYQLYGLLKYFKGLQRVGSHGENIGKNGLYSGEEERRKLWEHTLAECRISS